MIEQKKTLTPAFSMMSAIVVVLVMSTISVMVLKTNIQSSRLVLDIYRDRQAALWAKSYMEYAKLAISKNRELIAEDNSTNALESIYANIGQTEESDSYKIAVNISYMGIKDPFVCSENRVLDDSANNPSAVIDVYVKYGMLDKKWTNSTTYHIREVVGI